MAAKDALADQEPEGGKSTPLRSFRKRRRPRLVVSESVIPQADESADEAHADEEQSAPEPVMDELSEADSLGETGRETASEPSYEREAKVAGANAPVANESDADENQRAGRVEKRKRSTANKKTKRETTSKKESGRTGSKKAAPPRRTTRASLISELSGVVSFAGALLCVFALASYSPADPGFGVRGMGDVNNWIGPVGAYLADGLTLLLGIGAYGVPLLGFACAYLCFRPVFPRPRFLQGAGAIFSLLGVVTLLDISLGRASFLPYPAGGLFGAIVAGSLIPYVFPLGTGVLATFFVVVGGALLWNLPPATGFRMLLSGCRKGISSLRERGEVWQERRRLLEEERERIEDLVAEEEEERQAREQAEEELRKERVQKKAERLAKKNLAAKQEAEDKALATETATPQQRPVAIGIEVAPLPDIDPNAQTRVARAGQKNWTDFGIESDPPWVIGHDTEPGGPANPSLLVAEGEGSRPYQLEDKEVASENVAPAPAPEVLPPVAPLPFLAPQEESNESAAEDDAFVIVERAKGDAAQNFDDADSVVQQEKKAFELPPLKLLDYDAPNRTPVNPESLHTEAAKLVQKFRDFGIEGRVREVRPGPVCTTYEFVPAPGIKVSRIASLADDIAMAMEAIHVRIVAPIPGKGAVGIEIPNDKRETVFLKEVIADPSFRNQNHKLVMALGKDIEGSPYSANLAEMPHVLISGTTGSGKSVSVNAMICSILYRATPDEVKFLMIDPKMLELSIYEGIPHLLLPPIVDSKKAAVALKWAVEEMERRYQAMSDLGVRDVEGFNVRLEKAAAGDDEGRPLPKREDGTAYEKLPYIVVVVDEYADLLAVAGKDVEGYVMRLAQKARAAGIHVMLATQRPSVDVITGVIKANFPVRMGFRLASSHDSKTIVNRPGAEKLLGRGDMLIMPPGTSNLTRVHGAFISEKELHRVVSFLKEQRKPDYNLDILKPVEEEDGEGGGASEERDEKFDDAIRIVAKSRKCSTSWLQRQLGIGYNRAARIVEMMERQGLVGPTMSAKGDREIYIPPDD